MTEGAAEPVEQRLAPAAAAAGEPERKSWWERLKPLWWMRGFVGAIAVLGAMQIAEWPREEWLRVPHAIATRWQEIVGSLAAKLREVMPIPIDLTPSEAVRLVGMSAVQFPIVLGYYSWLRREDRNGSTKTRSALLLSVPIATLLPLGPGDIVSDTWVGAIWGMLVLTPVCWAAIRYPVRAMSTTVFLLIVGPPFTVSTVLLVTGQDSVPAQTLTLYALVAVIMWSVARTYAKAMFAAVTFILTLQAVYLVPTAREWVRPFLDWIDPAGARP